MVIVNSRRRRCTRFLSIRVCMVYIYTTYYIIKYTYTRGRCSSMTDRRVHLSHVCFNNNNKYILCFLFRTAQVRGIVFQIYRHVNETSRMIGIIYIDSLDNAVHTRARCNRHDKLLKKLSFNLLNMYRSMMQMI